jgi:DNA primase
LFPQSFLDDLRLHADIVAVVQDYVALRQSGASFKGLCPFHAEKTPSFTVNREKGFFHCFGCGASGDVIKFVEQQEGLSFPETVRRLASRFGLPVPEPERDGRDRGEELERETLLRAHEVAARFYRDQLASPLGRAARDLLAARDVKTDSADALGMGYAPSTRDALVRQLRREGFSSTAIVRGGLGVERDGVLIDRFRNRLMIPIVRESGSVVAFGGRAMTADQVPKYLNSPETPLYTKGRVLYGLHLTKQEVRKAGQAVVVEGYFDFAQAWQAGVRTAVASSGTALTPAQAHLIRRFASKIVLNFDADAAGEQAAVRSCDLLVGEGFQVAVALLPRGEDPDTFVRRHGSAAYQGAIAQARPYLEYLIERTAARFDLTSADGRVSFLNELLPVAARIPDPAARDLFGDRLAHRAQIGEGVVRDGIRRAAVAKQTSLPAQTIVAPALTRLKQAERDLLAALTTQPQSALAAIATLEDADLEGLGSARMLQAVRGLADAAPEAILSALLGRLNEEEGRLLTGLAAQSPVQAAPADCVRALRRLRYERERTGTQLAIDRLQERGTPVQAEELRALWERKRELARQIEALKT